MQKHVTWYSSNVIFVFAAIFTRSTIWDIEFRRGKRYDRCATIKVIWTNSRQARRCNNNIMARDDTISCEFTACRLSPIIAGSTIVFGRMTISFHADCLRFGTRGLRRIELLKFFVCTPFPISLLHLLRKVLHYLVYDCGGRERISIKFKVYKNHPNLLL